MIILSLFLFSVCKVNVHKRCQKNVANNCGINTREMSLRLKDLGIITGTKKKVSHIIFILVLWFFSVCKINVHKRCQKNVANNCGINTREMAEILQELGITTDKHGTRKKVSWCCPRQWILLLCVFSDFLVLRCFVCAFVDLFYCSDFFLHFFICQHMITFYLFLQWITLSHSYLLHLCHKILNVVV